MTLEQLQKPIYNMNFQLLSQYFGRLSLNDIIQLKEYKYAEAVNADAAKKRALERGDKRNAQRLQALVNIHHYESSCCFVRELELSGRYPTNKEIENYPLRTWAELLEYATQAGFFTESQSGG